MSDLIKPILPKQPVSSDYRTDLPFNEQHPYIKAYRKYENDMRKYQWALETYEQTKLIHLVKNATEKYCLKALKISRR